MTREASHDTGENKTQTITHLVANLLETWNSHDLDRIAALYAPEYEGVDVAQAAPRRGPVDVRRAMERYLSAFPDLHFTEDAILTQGNRTALFWTAHGTHQGKLMNIPATGRQIEVCGVSLVTVVDNKIVRGLHIWDVAGLLRNLNLLPEL